MTKDNPIYINSACIKNDAFDFLKENTERPVVLVEGNPKDHVLDNNITLRDYFASSALTMYQNGTVYTTEQIASNCYKIADAMLKERSKQ